MGRWDHLVTNKSTADGLAAMRREARVADPPDIVGVEACPNGTVRITIPGPPLGKPRMTQRDKWKQRPTVMRYREWCDRVREAVGDSLPAASDITELNWTAYFEPPASWSKKRRAEVIGARHRSTPDRDNIDKAILDCLFDRDEAIADGTLRKRWDMRARLEVEIFTSREAGGPGGEGT